MRYSAVASPRYSGAIVIPHKVVGGHREDYSAPLASLASRKTPVSRNLENDPAQRAPKEITHDLRLCCSPTCGSKLCHGCPEEHAGPNWCSDSEHDSETSSDVDDEDCEEDA